MLPKSFTLAGTVWSVVELPGLGELGRCERDTAQILIREDIPDQVKVSTFFHELVHAVWFTMGRTEHDEKEVDAMGHLLHQFATTCAYQKKRKGRK